jgi:acyl dehydratase
MKIYESVELLREAVGQHMGYSEWQEITQERINQFADATGDHQWIHVDREAAAAGPFGTTIAHGFLTLSLISAMTAGLMPVVSGITMVINYGANRVRFPAPVPVNSRVRAGVVLKSVEDVPGGIQLVSEVTIEREGGEKPSCVAEILTRYYL